MMLEQSHLSARPGPRRGDSVRRYAVAVAAALGAALLRWSVIPAMGTSAPYITFYLAIVVAAAFGGLGPGLAATLLGLVLGLLLTVPPPGNLVIGQPAEVVRMAIYLASGLGISLIGHKLRQAQQQLAAANAELEARVAERTARLQEMVHELEQMSYSMMHDMRAPLRAVVGFGTLVEEDPGSRLSESARGWVGKMITASGRMDKLVTDALNYSKLVGQTMPLGPVSPLPLLRGIVDTYPALQSSQAQVTLAPELPAVLGNEAALTQCFSQLLSNAVKFAKPGQAPRVRVRAERVQDGWVRLMVEDEGVGIAPAQQQRVFQMFERGSNATAGTGIGLALVKKAVERMGGRAGVESEEGKGSRFWVELRSAERADGRVVNS